MESPAMAELRVTSSSALTEAAELVEYEGRAARALAAEAEGPLHEPTREAALSEAASIASRLTARAASFAPGSWIDRLGKPASRATASALSTVELRLAS